MPCLLDAGTTPHRNKDNFPRTAPGITLSNCKTLGYLHGLISRVLQTRPPGSDNAGLFGLSSPGAITNGLQCCFRATPGPVAVEIDQLYGVAAIGCRVL